MAGKEENEKTIADDLVVTKYKMAGEIVNRVLKQVIAHCADGVSVRETSSYGDDLLVEETSKVFKKEKDLKKGIAFPTCLSVNNCVCHFSPLHSEPDYILKEGDVVKIDMGAHVDGFIAVVAHTIVIGASLTNKVTGRKADAILAAHFASEAALRLLKAGNETYTITDTVKKVAEAYQCKPIADMLSHQLKRFSIDGEKSIIQNPSEGHKNEHEKFEFKTHEVYAMDVIISTGDGVGKESTTRTAVFKKKDKTYQLKLKASRMFYSELIQKYGTLPFNLRYFDDEKKAKLGVTECINHKLVEPFQVLFTKPNEIVAQYKFTGLIMPNGPQKITGLPFEADLYVSDFSISDPEVKSILTSSAKSKKKKKKPINIGEEPTKDAAEEN